MWIQLLSLLVLGANNAIAGTTIKDMAGRWWVTKENSNYAATWLILATGEMGFEMLKQRPRLIPSDNQATFPSSEGWFKMQKYFLADDWGYIRLNNGTLLLRLFCDRCSDTFMGLNNYQSSADGIKQNILFLGTFLNGPNELIGGGYITYSQNNRARVKSCYEEAVSRGSNVFGLSDVGEKCYANDPNAENTYNANPLSRTSPMGRRGTSPSTSFYKILAGSTTDVVFNPAMIGRWYLDYQPGSRKGSWEIAVNADGVITDIRKFLETPVLSASDNQVQFPTKDGWFKVVNEARSSRSWVYVRLISGKLEWHYFCNDSNDCKKEYQGLENYCCNATGTKQDFTLIGCFQDNDENSVFNGGKINILSNPISRCYIAALENGVSYFGISNYGDCYANDPGAGKTYFKYGNTTGCSEGVGQMNKVNVYKLTKVNGKWGEWTKYGECNGACGSEGNQTRTRFCKNSSPDCLLSDGSGDRGKEEKQIRSCETQSCPVAPTPTPTSPSTIMWLSNSRCGPAYLLPNGMKAQCNPAGNTPCCSGHGFCGNSPDHCECPICLDYRQECVYNDMNIVTETSREVRALSTWKECLSQCQRDEKCMGWVWTTQTYPDESFHKVCALKEKADKEKLTLGLGLISGLKDCQVDHKSGDISSEGRNWSQPKITTCSYIASCRANRCTRGAVLEIGNSLRSENGKYTAVMQNDGNFVIYCNDHGQKAIWSSRTDGNVVYEGLNFQEDGNLVLYTISGGNKEAIWSSNTSNSEADHLIIQENGNLAIYGFYGYHVIWESRTYGMC